MPPHNGCGGQETAIIDALGWDELLIFFQSALIPIAGDPGRSASGSIAAAPVTSVFLWPARLQAGGVAIQLSGRRQSHHLNRDEQRRMIKPDLRQSWPMPRTISYYATAVLSVAVAIIAAELITRLLHAEAIASSMLCAVIFAAWLGGLGPALLAIVLALFAFHYYLVPPINSFTWKHDLSALDISEVPRLILFSIVCLFVALVIAGQRKAKEAFRRSSDDLLAAIEDQKRIEAALLHSEMYLTEAQRLSCTGSFGWNVSNGNLFWSDETYRIFQYDRAAKPALEVIVQRTHPDDRAAVQKTIDDASRRGRDFDHEYRLLMPGGSVKYVHAVAHAARDASGGIEFVGAITDVTDAKDTERKLRRSEAYLAETQHLSHTSSWAWDVRGRKWAYRSAAVYNLFGFDPGEGDVPLQAFRDRIFPADRPRNIEAASRAIREKADFEVDFRIALPDGSVKHIHSVGHPVVNDDGEVVELVGTHLDVTEQYEAREKLQRAFDEIKKSEDRLQLVIDTIPTLVWRAGPEGIPDFLNQPALDYTGLSLDQAETGWPRAFHPEDKKGMLQKWSAIRESGMRGSLEARLRRFDGEYRWFLFEAVPLRDESGNIVKWYGSSTDIEDRKRAEEALRGSEQRFRDYAETASDWFWETGPDHRTIRVSEHLSAVGIVPARLTGSARWDFATDVESEPEKWRLHRAMHEAHLPFRDFVYSTVSGSGSPVYVRSSGKPVFDTSGNFLGFRGTGTDITATIRADHAEQELREAQAELAHVTRVTTLGELTASIAHEVNQPLAAVIANAEACLRWLDRETPDLAAARRSAEWVINDGIRASEVVRRVRALAHKTDVEKVPLDVNDIVGEVILLVQRELASHRVSLRTELASALPNILGDRVQLQQVIINLVMNGIEAMQPVADRPRELVIRSRQEEMQRVLLSVTDCGVGISAENANRLFNAFFTTKSSGLGMGLSICRSIVEAHGGRLSASGDEGRGATFQFVLPVHQEDAS
jgi:PAS domain S-box-containing protein